MNLTKFEKNNVKSLLFELAKHYSKFSQAEKNFWYFFDYRQATTLQGLFTLIYMSSKYQPAYDIWKLLKKGETKWNTIKLDWAKQSVGKIRSKKNGRTIT